MLPPASNSSPLRILDAGLNRATEGLRVVEDYLRMVLDDRHLAELAKQLRHDLHCAAAGLPRAELHAMRDTVGDVGTTITTPTERERVDPWQVASASLARTGQSLRSLEEYGKLVDGQFASACESLRYRLYTLEKAASLTQSSLQRLSATRLYVLLDARPTPEEFERVVQELVAAGVGALQLRAKGLADRQLLDRAKRLVAVTRGTPTLAIVNDRADIAAAAAADGVHLGQDDLSVAAARRIVGPQRLVGLSTHNLDQARQGVLDGADYLGAGPTFPSTTKEFDDFPGLGFLQTVAGEIALPVFAIGGITPSNLSQVLATGIDRVAVAGAVTAADDPTVAVRQLREAVESECRSGGQAKK